MSTSRSRRVWLFLLCFVIRAAWAAIGDAGEHPHTKPLQGPSGPRRPGFLQHLGEGEEGIVFVAKLFTRSFQQMGGL